MDAPLETLLKVNNVDNNLPPMEKSFLDLRLFLSQRDLKGGAGTKILKGGTC